MPELGITTTFDTHPNAIPEGKILAFDYGLKRIGIAVGQGLTCSATPVTTLDAKQGEPDWSQVVELLKQWRPVACVVGIPFNMDGSESEMTQRVYNFVKALRSHYNRPIYGMDERLSSYAAEQMMIQEDHKSIRDKKKIDSMAAKIILESWLHEFKDGPHHE